MFCSLRPMLMDVTDNEDIMMIWVGASASPQLLLDLFGVEDINQVNRNMVGPPPHSLHTTNTPDISYRPTCHLSQHCSRRKSGISSHIGRCSGEVLYRGLPCVGRTWTAPRSSSVTSSLRIRTAERCLILIVSRDPLAVARIPLIVVMHADLCVVHKQISVAVSVLCCKSQMWLWLIAILTAHEWRISEYQQ